MKDLPPLSLYVHLPWCIRKCPYCDFNSYRAPDALPEGPYVDALLRDLEGEAEAAGERALESVFIGGGTPSLFSGPAIARLLEGVAAQLRLPADAEVTLEANPGAIDAARFGEFRAAGVTRLSLGIQSFRDDRLVALGRIHDGAEARRAAEAALDGGFSNVNLDLMYGLPGDDVAGSLEDLEQAIGLGPAHLSWYQLTLEPNTAFNRRPPALPEEETVTAIEEEGRRLLERGGFERYEISAYARPGRRCRHNLNYWQFGDYLGIGAGAHGKLTGADGAVTRRAKQRNPRTYVALAGSPAAFTDERVESAGQVALEFLMNALRLPGGVTVTMFEQRTGQGIEAIAEPLAVAAERGWLGLESEFLRATPAGLRMLNSLLELFVALDERAPA